MTIRHHPDELFLTRLAAGTLDPAFALVVHAHLDHCARCRGDMRALDGAAGILLEEIPQTPMQDEALDWALARLDAPAPKRQPAAKTASRRRDIAFGIWYRPLHWDKASGMRAYELHVPAGQQMPVHGHSGLEVTCVVQGSFIDETGRFETGDFVAANGSLKHSPHAGEDGDCVCLIASHGPLKMQGLVARAMQLYLQI